MGEDYETQLENLMDTNPQTGSQGEDRPVNPEYAWILRMIGEATELDQRGRKLNAFINNDPKFKELGIVDQYLLQNQQRYMAGYYGILTERIKRAENPEYAKEYDAKIAAGDAVGSGGTDGNG